MKLDLACGQRREKGFKGVDIAAGPEIDFVCDLEKYPWPFEDNSVQEIRCCHYVEHVSDLFKFMNEVWRICSDDAKVTFIAPYYASVRALADPTHKNYISEMTWLYFTDEWRKSQKLDHYPINANFAITNISYYLSSPWDKKSQEAQAFAKEHYWNVVSDMVVELRAIK